MINEGSIGCSPWMPFFRRHVCSMKGEFSIWAKPSWKFDLRNYPPGHPSGFLFALVMKDSIWAKPSWKFMKAWNPSGLPLLEPQNKGCSIYS